METTYDMLHNCPLCESEQHKPIKGYEKDSLHRCGSCGFVFSGRMPSKEELDVHYSNYSYGGAYYDSPITLKRYHELLDKFEKYRKTNKLLDVGCGNGGFLQVAKERNWDCLGIEYSQQAVQNCKTKGLNVLQGSLGDYTGAFLDYDVVTSFEVMEHLQWPSVEIKNIHKVLRKGGLAYVTTPNFNSIMRYYLKDKYDALAYPEHLMYFTARTLKSAFVSRGFYSLKSETTGISINRFLNSKGSHKENPYRAGSRDENLREATESNWVMKVLKRIINGILNFTRLGLSLKGRFVKV